MSFFRKPELFLYYSPSLKSIHVMAFYDKFGTAIGSEAQEYIGPAVFTPYLSLGDNKMSDFDAFFDYLTRAQNNDKYVNCQGLVIRLSKYPDKDGRYYKWSPRTLDTSFFGLPAHEDPRAKEKELAMKLDACMEEANRERVEKQALENVVRELKTKNSTLQQTISGLNAKNCALEGEVERVQNEKNALITDLDLKKIDLDGKNIEILTLYKQTILSLKAKSATLECEMERVKIEKNHICKEEEDTRERKEKELQLLMKIIQPASIQTSSIEDC